MSAISKLHPLGNWIVLEHAQASRIKSRESGVITIAASNAQQQVSRVVAVGPGKTLDNGETEKMRFSAGQRVLFNPSTAIEVIADETKYYLLDAANVFAVVKETQEVLDEKFMEQRKSIEILMDMGVKQLTADAEYVSLIQASPSLWFLPATDDDADKDTQHAWFAGTVTLNKGDDDRIELFCLR